MALTDRQYLGTVLLRNIEGTFSNDELDEFVTREGDVSLAYARALEVEASRVRFSFSAGDVSADQSKYANNLLAMAKQVRESYATYGGDISEMVSWSGSAVFGTEAVTEYIDEDYNEPTW
jgi:hypothetical protein